jgi:hypothetical protein
VGKQPPVLRYIADPAPQPNGVEPSHIGALDQNQAIIGIDQPIETPKQGRLPGSTLAHQRYAFSSANCE